MKTRSVLASICFFAACSSSTTAPTSALTGTWAEATSIPGVRLVMTLTETGTNIVGSGSYAIEAGRSGTLQVSGVEGLPVMTLTLQYDSGTTATFTGALTDASHLTGTLAYSNDGSGSVTFIRQ
jgi:hypothetical protein